MAYFEPPNSLQHLSSKHPQKTRIHLEGRDGPVLEVEAFDRRCWALEVRYDKCFVGVTRQNWTIPKSSRAGVPVEATHAGDNFTLRAAGLPDLVINAASAAFELRRADQTLLRSTPAPFRAHAEPVAIQEGLLSLKVTDFLHMPVQTASHKKFPSHMLRFEYERPEGPILGLAGQTGEANRNGYRFQLYNTDEFMHTPERKPMYQSWPIVMHHSKQGGEWVGVFHDNPSRTFVDCGDFYKDRVSFESITGNTRVLLFAAPSLAELSSHLVKTVGVPALPPLWAFGYQQCRWSYLSTAELREVAAKLRSEDFPCDALYLDIHHMDEYKVFTHDKKLFPDLAKTLTDLKRDEFHTICIVDPGVKIEPGYEIHDRLLAEGKVLATESGDPLPAAVWPGAALLPDFGDRATQELWATFETEWLKTFAFDGIWNDMNEPSNFLGGNQATSAAQTERGSFQKESNHYGMRMAEASALGWEQAHPGKRPLIITRSGYPGVQQFAVGWHGDNQAWWEHLQLAIDLSVQFSLAGLFYSGADVPGFTGNPPADLAVRFYQLGAFLPLFRGHSIYFSSDKEPYCFGSEASDLIRKAIKLRYSLLREWYTGFAHASETGRSPLEPVLANKNLVRDQFLLFEKFLVAPVIRRDEIMRTIYLPRGSWYRLGETTQCLKGERWITEAVTLGSIPIFVRAGSIVVRNEPGKSTVSTIKNKEYFEIYPDGTGAARGLWYEDDGISINRTGAKHVLLKSQTAEGSLLGDIVREELEVFS